MTPNGLLISAKITAVQTARMAGFGGGCRRGGVAAPVVVVVLVVALVPLADHSAGGRQSSLAEGL